MNTKRLQLALERIHSGDWARFERFASQFLASEHPALRTTANEAGDLGRDSELFSPEGDSTILLQYSVTESWKGKIRETAKRIRENFRDAILLVYVTNRKIGAEADAIKKEVRDTHRLILDVYDQNWFLERASEPSREKVAEELAVDIVDPYLASRNVIENKAVALTAFEAKAAVLHLQLQWEDDSREKGLTKLSYDALVRSVLRGTSSEHRMSAATLHDEICKLLPAHPRDILQAQVTAAIGRLDRRAIRRWHKTDEVCLTFEESIRVRDDLAKKETEDAAFSAAIDKTIQNGLESAPREDQLVALRVRVRRVLDFFLLQKGEEFVSAVVAGRPLAIRDDTLDTVVTNDFAANPDETGLGDTAVALTRRAATEILQRASPETQTYLRKTADSYTLFAFLRAVPDVQRVVQKIFRDGSIWIDASVLLPVLVETLLPPEEQLVSRLFRAAHEAGIKLFVTSGIVEEVERHINRSIIYVRTPAHQWVGSAPFLAAMFTLSGRSSSTFASWTENFCGSERPRDDLAEYLKAEWHIELKDLTAQVDKTPTDLRWEVERIWREAHEARRRNGTTEIDAFVVDRLIKHDVECFLGVIGMRTASREIELGYSHWWLTFDKTVRELERTLQAVLRDRAPKVPTMSPDFLANYLALGPTRERVSKDTERTIPVAMFSTMPAFVPPDLVQLADAARKSVEGASDRLLRRKLRDALDACKTRHGDVAAGGFAAIKEKIESAFRSHTQRPGEASRG